MCSLFFSNNIRWVVNIFTLFRESFTIRQKVTTLAKAQRLSSNYRTKSSILGTHMKVAIRVAGFCRRIYRFAFTSLKVSSKF